MADQDDIKRPDEGDTPEEQAPQGAAPGDDAPAETPQGGGPAPEAASQDEPAADAAAEQDTGEDELDAATAAALAAAQEAVAIATGAVSAPKPAGKPPVEASKTGPINDADIAAAMAAAALEKKIEEQAEPLRLPDFGPGAKGGAGEGGRFDLLNGVNLNVKIELGRTRMLLEDVLRLGEGAVVELDKLAGDPVDVFVNDRHVARGEVLVLNDNFCVRINEIVDPALEGERGAARAGR